MTHTKNLMMNPIKDIFGDIILPKKEKIESVINGMSYIENWLSDPEQSDLITEIDSMPWDSKLKRRVQQYGYIYDYRKATTMITSNQNNYIGELPIFLKELAKRLKEESIFSEEPDQVIINEYNPGQGIAFHIDCVPCFNDTVVSLSLGSQCVMDLRKKDVVVNKVLNQKSILILKGESRYDWFHGIRANTTDLINSKRVQRGRRISITFRKII